MNRSSVAELLTDTIAHVERHSWRGFIVRRRRVSMCRTITFFVNSLTVLAALFLGSEIFAADLAPHVLAQVDEAWPRGPAKVSIRIFEDGKIEKFDEEQWTEIGRLSKPAILRFKNVTDVMTPNSKLHTTGSDPALADGPSTTYSVRNKEGLVVLVGTQNAILLQGGASSIVQVLDGFKSLARISY